MTKDSSFFKILSNDQKTRARRGEVITAHGKILTPKHRFTPEKSIEIQQKLGADMMVAFDECAPYPTTSQYARTAMERTHRWALRSLKAAQGKPLKSKQFLFGVIQGSIFKDWRQQSAQFISSLDFDGLASYHNLFFMEQLFAKIRGAIEKGEFLKFSHFYLGEP